MTIFILILWNIFSFILMGIDKYKATHHLYRIPEKFLLLTAMIFGSFGTLLGMILFRHKIRTNSFIYLVPIFSIIQCCIVIERLVNFD
ncbi:MAG: DUF1294 domain-containing protein [Longicatena sp.]